MHAKDPCDSGTWMTTSVQDSFHHTLILRASETLRLSLKRQQAQSTYLFQLRKHNATQLGGSLMSLNNRPLLLLPQIYCNSIFNQALSWRTSWLNAMTVPCKLQFIRTVIFMWKRSDLEVCELETGHNSVPPSDNRGNQNTSKTCLLTSQPPLSRLQVARSTRQLTHYHLPTSLPWIRIFIVQRRYRYSLICVDDVTINKSFSNC